MNSKSIKKKMSEALIRSGYLMESRIVTSLAKAGYFIEPNQKIADLKTGKSREIDLIAELWDYAPEIFRKYKLSVSARFVCEAKNNPNPVVLLTKLPFSPNIEVWEAIKEGRTGLFRNDYSDPSFQDLLLDERPIFTQYCSFKPKKAGDKSEWVAWHPDDFNEDLEKIIYYCDEEIGFVNDMSDEYNRLHIYLPVVILGGDLYLSEPGARSINLKKVDAGFYMHFGIKNDVHFLALVAFVTEKYLLKFFEKTNDIAQQLEQQAIDSLESK